MEHDENFWFSEVLKWGDLQWGLQREGGVLTNGKHEVVQIRRRFGLPHAALQRARARGSSAMRVATAAAGRVGLLDGWRVSREPHRVSEGLVLCGCSARNNGRIRGLGIKSKCENFCPFRASDDLTVKVICEEACKKGFYCVLALHRKIFG